MARRREFHPEASLDIEEISDYIAQSSLAASDRVAFEIETSINKAQAFPQIGHLRPDLTSRPLLFIKVYDYLIAYAFDDERLLVIAVLHGRRSPQTLADLLQSRQSELHSTGLST